MTRSVGANSTLSWSRWPGKLKPTLLRQRAVLRGGLKDLGREPKIAERYIDLLEGQADWLRQRGLRG